MSAKNRIEIDTEGKRFVLSQRDYKELMNNPGGEIGKQIKGLLALGCYEGYVPAAATKAGAKDKPVNFTEAGVEAWIQLNNPEWATKWSASKEVKTPDNSKFGFMVRKNYFLFENPEAREYCGMKPDSERREPYELQPSAAQLKKAVEKYLANKAKK